MSSDRRKNHIMLVIGITALFWGWGFWLIIRADDRYDSTAKYDVTVYRNNAPVSKDVSGGKSLIKGDKKTGYFFIIVGTLVGLAGMAELGAKNKKE